MRRKIAIIISTILIFTIGAYYFSSFRASAGTASDRMILMWDTGNGAVPTGWTSVSGEGGDFYQKFIKGAGAYDAVGGGAATHDHSNVSFGLNNTVASVDAALGGTTTTAGHTHAASTQDPAAGSNLPSYRNLVFIKADSPTSSIPADAIAFFDDALPGGWTRYADQDTYYIRGEATAGSTSGSNTHNHAISGTSAAYNTGSFNNWAGWNSNASLTGHTHSIGVTYDSASNQPQHADIILAYNSSGDSALAPEGMIAIFDDTPADSGNWTIVSDVGGDLNGDYLLGAAAYNAAAGGANTHTHSAKAGTSGAASAASAIGTYDTSGDNDATVGNHTHSFTASALDSQNHEPPYIEVILAKLTTALDPDAPGGEPAPVTGKIIFQKGILKARSGIIKVK